MLVYHTDKQAFQFSNQLKSSFGNTLYNPPALKTVGAVHPNPRPKLGRIWPRFFQVASQTRQAANGGAAASATRRRLWPGWLRRNIW